MLGRLANRVCLAGVTNNRSEQRADGLRGDRNARGSRGKQRSCAVAQHHTDYA